MNRKVFAAVIAAVLGLATVQAQRQGNYDLEHGLTSRHDQGGSSHGPQQRQGMRQDLYEESRESRYDPPSQYRYQYNSQEWRNRPEENTSRYRSYNVERPSDYSADRNYGSYGQYRQDRSSGFDTRGYQSSGQTGNFQSQHQPYSPHYGEQRQSGYSGAGSQYDRGSGTQGSSSYQGSQSQYRTYEESQPYRPQSTWRSDRDSDYSDRNYGGRSDEYNPYRGGGQSQERSASRQYDSYRDPENQGGYREDQSSYGSTGQHRSQSQSQYGQTSRQGQSSQYGGQSADYGRPNYNPGQYNPNQWNERRSTSQNDQTHRGQHNSDSGQGRYGSSQEGSSTSGYRSGSTSTSQSHPNGDTSTASESSSTATSGMQTFRGTIQDVDSDNRTIEVRGRQGTRQFTLESSAQMRKDGQTAQLDQFETGDSVIVRFKSEGNTHKAVSVREDTTQSSRQ